jgi:hypothetical protein
MHESMGATTPHEIPSTIASTEPAVEHAAQPIDTMTDPRVLQILTTEHWSLLSARALVYNEAFSRAAMFLAFLSMSFVALGLIGPAMTFSREFLLLAAVILFFDLVIGLGTLGRVVNVNAEDFRAIAGMNRIRHGYTEIAPIVAPYLSTSIHDDIRGVFATYGGSGVPRGLVSLTPGLTTTSGMIGTTVSLVAGVLVGVLTLALMGSASVAVALAALATAAMFAAVARFVLGSIRRTGEGLVVRFPSPQTDGDRRAR